MDVATELRSTASRYLFALVTVAVAFALRVLIAPLTGTGAPFVLFFAATLVTSLYAGVGPALCALLVSLPVAAFMFVVRAGYPVSQAVFQALLYAVDGWLVIYITSLMSSARRRLQVSNRELVAKNDEIARSEARTREVIDSTPDAFFLADLDARFTDVNEAACHMLGYAREELVGKTIFDIIPAEDAPRLEAAKVALLRGERMQSLEWTHLRKDGTLLPVEVSANILPDGRWQAFVRDISARRRLEDERQVFVSFLENSWDFIGIADPSGKPIYVNPAGRRMVGLADDQPIEQTEILDYYPAEHRSFAADVIVKSMIERGRWSGETWFRNWQTGEAIPVSDEHFMIRDPRSKRVLGMGTITRDISEARRVAREREESLEREQVARHQAEAAYDRLRESEERFRLTIDEAPIGMALVALDGRFVRVNEALCEIVGYEPAELIRMTFQEITHPDDLGADLALVDQLVRGQIPRYQLAKRYVRKDRTIVDVMLSGSILRGRDGTPLYFIAQIEDVTERKRAEDALRLSEAKFAAIVSIAAEAIISVDEHQRIVIFNEGAERIFGYARDEVIGRPFDILIPERFRALHGSHFIAFAAGPWPVRQMAERGELFGLRKSGDEFPAEASISKVEVGKVKYLSVVLRDVTARKRAEAAMHEAIAARDQVLAIVAHDLRNPLNSIVMASALLDDARPERRKRNTDRIVSAAKRMNHLIQDLLDVSLVEAGELKITRAPVSPAELAREAVEAQRSLVDAAGLEICVDVERGVPDVLGDHHRLLQVFDNLVGNAIKFTAAGGRITVGAACRDHDVVFWVADTGCGIARQSLPHVFDRFWQAAARSNRLGAGLGLPITRGIVEAHGGRIWVESMLGQGSTFYFTIPKAALAEDGHSAR